MTHKEHCDECRQKLSRDWSVVHLWLDYYARYTYPSDRHRIHRHNLNGVEEVRHKWGDEAAKAAELHILADVKAYGMDHVPSMAEAEELWAQEIIHHPNGKIEIKKRMECD